MPSDDKWLLPEVAAPLGFSPTGMVVMTLAVAVLIKTS
jgi:hypothetical protein